MKLLLDTSVLIDFLRGSRGRRELIGQLRLDHAAIAVSAITVAEIYSGCPPSQQAAFELLFQALEVIPTDFVSAKLGGEMRFHWARKGRTLSLTDTLIAATALQHGLTLLTDNARDFPMPDLKLYPSSPIH
jgi:predicted nucleic acid-binding protein